MTQPLTQDDLDALKRYDTPTICNALEIVAPDRRTMGFTTEQFSCLDPKLPPIVGYARTATIRAAEPPIWEPRRSAPSPLSLLRVCRCWSPTQYRRHSRLRSKPWLWRFLG